MVMMENHSPGAHSLATLATLATTLAERVRRWKNWGIFKVRGIDNHLSTGRIVVVGLEGTRIGFEGFAALTHHRDHFGTVAQKARAASESLGNYA